MSPRLKADPDVPRIPRGRGLKVTNAQVFKILLTAAVLVMLIVMQRPCADSVSKFVTSFDDQGSASPKMPKPDNVDVVEPQHYEVINSDMTEAQVKAAIERERARAAEARKKAELDNAVNRIRDRIDKNGSGSAASGSAGSGSAAGSAP